MSNWGMPSGHGLANLDAARVNIARAGAADTWSAWGELVAAAPAGVHGLRVTLGVRATRREVIQLGLGSGGAEVPFVTIPRWPSVFDPGDLDPNVLTPVDLPLRVPAGIRVAARVMTTDSVTGSASIGIMFARGAIGAGRAAGTVASTVGVTTTSGVTIGSAGAWSAWTELTAATAHPVRWAVVAGAHAAPSWRRVQLGVGAAGSEIPAAEHMTIPRYSDWSSASPMPPVAVSIPRGSRLAVRVFDDSSSAIAHYSAILIG